MNNPFSTNNRALKAIILEVVGVVLLILIILFVFKVISVPALRSPHLPKNSLPIVANSKNVQMALTTFVLIGEVKSISQTTNGNYQMVLQEFPNQSFMLNKNAVVQDPKTFYTIQAKDLHMGTMVRIGLTYDSQTNKWSEIPAASKIKTIHFTN